MALDYPKLVEDNISFLTELRNKCNPNLYPEEVLFNLFWELYSLTSIWEYAISLLKMGKITEPFDRINSMLWHQYVQDKVSSKSDCRYEFQTETKIGNISPSHFSKFIKGANRGNNKCTEELEFAFVTRRPIRDFFLQWLTYISLRTPPDKAYKKLVINYSFSSTNWLRFDEMFECVAVTTLAEIVGTKDSSGYNLTESIYKPLPPYNSKGRKIVHLVKKWKNKIGQKNEHFQ